MDRDNRIKVCKKTALIANVNFEIISINNLFKNSALINKTQGLKCNSSK